MSVENTKCGRILSTAQQLELLGGVSKSTLQAYALTDPTFPESFPNPISKGRSVRSENELVAWIEKAFAKIERTPLESKNPSCRRA